MKKMKIIYVILHIEISSLGSKFEPQQTILIAFRLNFQDNDHFGQKQEI